MCGILGLHQPNTAPQEIEAAVDRMNSLQHHRGPDESGVFTSPDLGLTLAMKRLSIVDEIGGRQPMISRDGRYTLVYNGEVVNAKQLRSELEGLGDVFSTDGSDTEVVLKVLTRFGTTGLRKLNGMFGIAVFDAQERHLLLARDSLGIKPLYFTAESGQFAFASEMKSLLTLPWVDTHLNPDALNDYLSLMYVTGERRIFGGIQMLPRGHVLSLDLTSGHVRINRWSDDFPTIDTTKSRADWIVAIREELVAAVKRWTMSDVPLAASLSGGLDSSVITSILASEGVDVRCFSLGFDGKGENELSELDLATSHAQRLGLTHEKIIMKPSDLLTDLGKMVWHLDEPYGGGLPSWLVYKAIGRSHKVAFTGVGGDELFGNYGKWVPTERIAMLGKMFPMSWFRHGYLSRFHYWQDKSKVAILDRSCHGRGTTSARTFEKFDAYRRQGASHRDAVARIDFDTQLPDEFLAMTDRFSMAHSVEARPPFLDRDLVNLVMSMPADLRTSRHRLKGVLREVAAPFLGDDILHAPKRGFVVPMKQWLAGELKPLVTFLLAEDRLARQGIFKKNLFEKVYMPFLNDRDLNPVLIWSLVMFQIWHLLYVENKASSGNLGIKEMAG